MGNVRLIVEEAGKEPREMEIFGEVTTFGRVKDNSVSFSSDTNVSRYHAQIVQRGAEFYVSDFGSSNGTTVNGSPLSGERLLHHGDKINLGGGESNIIFLSETAQTADEADEYAPGFSVPSTSTQTASAPPQSSNMPLMLTAAAVLSGVAIISVVGAVLYFWSDVAGGCTPEVAVLRPESGVTLTEATEVQVSVKNAKCIDRVAFLLDGEEIESVETAPYSVTLEPEKFEHLKDDESTHVLTVAVYDKNGARKLQNDSILLAFADPPKKSKEEPPTGEPSVPNNTPTSPRQSEITIAETKTMTEQLLRQVAGNGAYKLDVQFLREVQKKTAEYRAEGYHGRAMQYRDAINQAFVAEQGLDVPLGYILAMSRSKFDNKRGAANAEGLWQMTNEFAAANGYNGQCGAETLSDSRQTCAARAAAIYTKALLNVFQGDAVYAMASFGLSPAEVGQFAITLPPDRADFWNNIRNPKQRDALVRFFAAGIVAENPEKFSLRRDKKLSDVYKNLMILK
jgi:hypothetical protein